jgi:hypothetical protein
VSEVSANYTSSSPDSSPRRISDTDFDDQGRFVKLINASIRFHCFSESCTLFISRSSSIFHHQFIRISGDSPPALHGVLLKSNCNLSAAISVARSAFRIFILCPFLPTISSPDRTPRSSAASIENKTYSRSDKDVDLFSRSTFLKNKIFVVILVYGLNTPFGKTHDRM